MPDCPRSSGSPIGASSAAAQLDGLRHIVLVDAKPPVSFFAYPGRPSWLVPDGCEVLVLAGPADDVSGTLEALADEVGAPKDAARRSEPSRPPLPAGELTAQAVAAALGALLPEEAIVSDESNTSGLLVGAATTGCPPHDWLFLTGGAIGQGLPVALGAAVASPGRRVLALQADGSSLYTSQSWWTMARHGLDVTTVLFNNHSYAILNMELQRVGVEGGRQGPGDARSVGSRHRLRWAGGRHGCASLAGLDRRGVPRPDLGEALSRLGPRWSRRSFPGLRLASRGPRWR